MTGSGTATAGDPLRCAAARAGGTAGCGAGSRSGRTGCATAGMDGAGLAAPGPPARTPSPVPVRGDRPGRAGAGAAAVGGERRLGRSAVTRTASAVAGTAKLASRMQSAAMRTSRHRRRPRVRLRRRRSAGPAAPAAAAAPGAAAAGVPPPPYRRWRRPAYRRLSARARSAAASRPSLGKLAAPQLKGGGPRPRTLAMTRSASPTAAPSRTSTNSSPPRR